MKVMRLGTVKICGKGLRCKLCGFGDIVEVRI